ncbi:MAG: S8 family serine peptidase [Firmicutes bacterium]|nr:S8 family serine peptidase [Bacillota bacterium]
MKTWGYSLLYKKWKLILLFLGILAAAAATCSSVFAGEEHAAADTGQAYSDDRIVVVFEEDVTKAQARKLLAREELDEEQPNYLCGQIASVKLPSDVSPKEAVEKLKDDKAVKSVQPNFKYRFDGYTNDPEICSSKYSANLYKYHYLFQTGIAGPGLTAWNYAKGSGINVAVIDSGANVYHQDLKANIKGCYNSVTGQEGKAYVKDTQGHGSHIAGIIAATGNNSRSIAGIACKANLYIVKVNSEDGNIYTEDLIEGMRWAVYEKNCRVVNLSLGSDYDTKFPAGRAAEEEFIRQAYNNGKGTLTVCSGGNSGTGAYHYPASWEESLSVSALTYNSVVGYQISARSNFNDQIDVAAPGSMMYTVSHSNNTNIACVDSSNRGTTSYSTAYTSGVAALILSANPELTAPQCARILKGTAWDAGAAGKDDRYGYGIVNPLAAVQNAKLKGGRDFYLVYRDLKGVASAYTKSLSSRQFALRPSFEGSGVLRYSSSRPNVATVSSKGTITLKGSGRTRITVSLPQSGIYRAASETILLTVKPKRLALSKVAAGKRYLKANWKRDKKVSGYQVSIARDSKFTKGKKTGSVKGNKTVSKTFKKLPKGAVYYVKVRSYKTSGGKNLYGPYSKVKKVRIK